MAMSSIAKASLLWKGIKPSWREVESVFCTIPTVLRTHVQDLLTLKRSTTMKYRPGGAIGAETIELQTAALCALSCYTSATTLGRRILASIWLPVVALNLAIVYRVLRLSSPICC